MLLSVLIAILTFFLYKNSLRSTKYPPGPLYIPVVGNLVAVAKALRKLKCHHLVWNEWSKKYGNILGLKLAGTNVIVVSGIDAIKEASTIKEFDGRPNGFFYMMRSFGKKLGIVFSDGPEWARKRSTLVKYLRNFGFGSRSMDRMIAEECKALVELLREYKSNPVHVNDMFDVPITNVIWRLLAGKRYDLKDKKFCRVCQAVKECFKVVDMSGGILNMMPFLRYIIPNSIGYTQLRDIHNELYEFIKETIVYHQQTLDVKSPRDVIDAILIEASVNGSNKYLEEDIQVTCLDILEAGTETVGNTLAFLLLYLIRNPKIQKTLQDEIDSVIGIQRQPSHEDINSMPYTEAVILEALRLSSVAPVGIPHMATKTASLQNYIIPKGSVLLLSIHSIHMDDLWGDPKVFRPERFLEPQGQKLRETLLMPFGHGRRRCIGEPLAKTELFLFLVNIMQNFNIAVPHGRSEPSTEPVNGVSLSPQPYQISFYPRV